jgi:hypothetical protein
MWWPFVGERKALSLFVLGSYTTLLILFTLGMESSWKPCFAALSLTYGIGFFGLAAGWFWARWFSLGLGLSGLLIAGLGLVTQGWHPVVGIFGGIHLLIALPICGDRMADLFENQESWLSRTGIDESGMARLRKSVISAASALPTLILYTLGPRQTANLVVFALASLGLFGLLRLRFWGVAVLALSSVGAALSPLWAQHLLEKSVEEFPIKMAAFFGFTVPAHLACYLAAALLAAAVLPFVAPAWKVIRAPR